MAYYLTLSGASGSYVSIPSSSQFDITNNFKISITFAPQDLNSTNKYLMNRAHSVSGNSWAIIWEYTNNQVEFYSFGFTGSDPRSGSGITLPDSNQHTIIYEYDGTTFKGWLDGVQKFALTKTFSLPSTNSSLYIGASGPTTDNLAGSLYDVGFYKGGVLAGQWVFNIGSGTTISDGSGNGNTATITGGAWGGSGGVTGGGALTGTGSLSAAGLNNIAGSASLTGLGSLTASGINKIAGSSALQGNGSLTASGTVTSSSAISGSASLQGTGTLTATGAIAISGGASLQGSGTLTMIQFISGSASLTGVGTLTASGVVGAFITSGINLLADRALNVSLLANKELAVSLQATMNNRATMQASMPDPVALWGEI